MSRPARPSNHDVCDAFRELLTAGCPEELRDPTKAWRGEIWKAFGELERRLCPFPRIPRTPAPLDDEDPGPGQPEKVEGQNGGGPGSEADPALPRTLTQPS